MGERGQERAAASLREGAEALPSLEGLEVALHSVRPLAILARPVVLLLLTGGGAPPLSATLDGAEPSAVGISETRVADSVALWVDGSGRPTRAARAALALLAGAATDALDPADYQASALESAATALEGVPDPAAASIAAFDTGLSANLLRDEDGWSRDRIVAGMNGDRTRQVNLTRPIQVILFYVTAAVMPEDGTIRFAADVYGHDAKLDRALARAGSRP